MRIVNKEKFQDETEHGLYDAMTIYRSSDDALLGGVFAGLAHKWSLNKNGLRIAFVIFVILIDFWLTLYVATIITIAIYFVFCMIFPKRPTKLSPEEIAFMAIQESYRKGDLHLSIHYAEKFLHNNPMSPKRAEFERTITELKKKI